MGLIGDAFGALFGFLGDLFGQLFSAIWGAIEWLLKGIASLFQMLIDLVVSIFTIIFEVIQGLLYLIYMIGVLAVKLFFVMFEAGKLLFSLVTGFARTLASLTYTPRSGAGHGYSEMMGKIMSNLNYLQIDVVAYIALFVIWFITAIYAMKIISSIRVGGD